MDCKGVVSSERSPLKEAARDQGTDGRQEKGMKEGSEEKKKRRDDAGNGDGDGGDGGGGEELKLQE
jgi:hypothetical protein